MGRYDRQDSAQSRNLVIIGLVAVLAIAVLLYWLSLDKPEQDPVQIKATMDLPAQLPIIDPPLTTGQMRDQADWAQRFDSITEDSVNPDIEIDALIQEQDLVQLPPLAESDPLFKEDMVNLSGGINNWLNSDQLITKYLTVVNDFAQGLRISNHMRYFTLDEPFKVGRDRHGLYLEPQGYQRYDKLAATIDAIDVPVAMMLYSKYRPLLLEVFTEFGYPQGHQLEDLFRKSASEILEAPIIEDRISIYRPSVRYKFSSPKLENLSPVQKQMIRMGPNNTRIIQQKVRLLIEALSNRPDSDGLVLG